MNNQILIGMVEERPVLWDRTDENYKNRQKTAECWTEICRLLIDGYDEMPRKSQRAIDKEVLKKWTNIKDGFSRWHRKCNELIRLGSNKTIKKYVYYDHISFLLKNMVSNQDELTFEDNDPLQVEEGTLSDVPTKRLKLETSTFEIKPSPTRLESELSNTFEASPSPSYQSSTNRHMAFFSSVLPSIENFDDDQFCDFQIGVLQLIRSLKRRENPKD